MISSYVGENAEFMRQYLSGELELEFNPQGTLAERMRAGGCGIPGFYTRTGVGTVIAEGKDGQAIPNWPRRRHGRLHHGKRYLCRSFDRQRLGRPMTTGNIIFRKTARNFNRASGDMCGKVCIAEVEEIVPTGRTLGPGCDPSAWHLCASASSRANTKNASNSAPRAQA